GADPGGGGRALSIPPSKGRVAASQRVRANARPDDKLREQSGGVALADQSPPRRTSCADPPLRGGIQRRLAASSTPAPAIRIPPETRSAISCARADTAARRRAAHSTQIASPITVMIQNVAASSHSCACRPSPLLRNWGRNAAWKIK